MKEKGSIADSKLMQAVYKMIVDLSSKPLRRAEESRIAHWTYSKVDLAAHVCC